MAKKHKLFVVTPFGECVQLGFLSPSRDGFIIGTPKAAGASTSHLTVISKAGTLSSHITPQEHPENRRRFPELGLKEFAQRLREYAEQSLASPLPTEQLSDEVFYVTQKLLDWLDSVKNTLYERRTSPKEVIHVLNFKRLVEKLPQLIEELRKSPSAFFGMCQAEEILTDNSKTLAITKSKQLVMPIENQLYLVNFSFLTEFSPVMEQQNVSSPLSEIYRSMGIHEYMEEVKTKRILEKLLSKTRKSRHTLGD